MADKGRGLWQGARGEGRRVSSRQLPRGPEPHVAAGSKTRGVSTGKPVSHLIRMTKDKREQNITLYLYTQRWPVSIPLKYLGGVIQGNLPLPPPPDSDTISVWIKHQPEPQSLTLIKAFTVGETRRWEIGEDPIWHTVPEGSTVGTIIIFHDFRPTHLV